MTHLQRIEKAMLDAQSKIHSYKMSVALFTGIPGNSANEMLEESREAMADALMILYQAIEPTVKVAPTPTGSDNVVTLSEEFHS